MGDADEKKSDSVKVAIRLRPLSKKEVGNNEVSCVEIESSTADDAGSVTINDPEGKEKPAQFAFDIVFNLDTLQSNVFNQVGRPAVNSMLSGYNGTIFAYGQTGSGKSWSMTGAEGDLRGIIPRVNETIFERIAEIQAEIATRQFLVMCSFFEIYNEIIFDLLNPCQDRSKLGAGLQIKEHPVLGIYVKDLQEIVVSDADKLEKLMTSGIKNRAVSATQMNSVSSRSHSIFTIKMHQKDDADKSRNVFAKLNLVDLAGSERQKGTGATGQTLKEGANINKSLSALGNVINALVENANGKKVFVPFRNSKLTRVLQESLGGNSLCTMLAALSPAACNYEETVSTLRYANRAKAIKVSATKNEEASQISRLNAEIAELKKKLESGVGGGSGGGGGLMAEEEREEIKAKFTSQLADMEKMLNSTWEEKQNLSKTYEAQVSKALDEQKAQAKAMEQECRKRFRLLQDQGDLELTIRGLMGACQSLPSEATERSAGKPWVPLLAGEHQRQWLKAAAAMGESAASLQQQQTMAKVFQGAFIEDLKLWVEGEEASDHGMARTGARRAITKMETLRREYAKLNGVEIEGRTRSTELAQTVAQVRQNWLQEGASAVLQATERQEVNEEEPASPVLDGSVPNINSITIEDISRLLELIETQATAKVQEFAMMAAIEVGAYAELIMRGLRWTPENSVNANDMALLRSMASASAPDMSTGSAPAAPAPSAPREERPLHEWTPQDAESSVDGTEYTLLQLTSLDSLNKKKTPKELLARPPPKFVHDVALLIKSATGFMPTMMEDWPDPREGKIELLQFIADSVAGALGISHVDFDPADVLKGKAVEKTLRLLQLLAIAAAKSSAPANDGGGDADGGGQNGGASNDEQKRLAGEMPPLLEAFERCVKVAIQHQDRMKETTMSGIGSPTKQLESSFRSLKERLEEEALMKQRHSERCEQLQKELEENRETLKQQQEQLDKAKAAVDNADANKEALRNQVQTLRDGLLHRAQSVAARNSEVASMKMELEQTAAELKEKSLIKTRLGNDVRKLQQSYNETNLEKESIETAMQLMKARLAEGLEGNARTQQDEEILVLHAEKEKLGQKVTSLEDKVKVFAEQEDADRQQEVALLEEKKVLAGKNDDVQMQLQVIIEERDALREGMDQLWQKKAAAYEELENVTQGYTHLSDRLLEKCEEAQELEEQLQKYENLFKMLQENFEKSRHSPLLSPPKTQERMSPSPPGRASPPPPQAPAVRGPAAPPPAKEDDQGSSHYSDDDFEEPDE